MKKTRRLLLQIIMIILPLFAAMTAAVSYTIYKSTTEGFLKSQNNHIRDTMSQLGYYLSALLGDPYGSGSPDWMLRQMENYRITLEDEPAEEDKQAVSDYLDQIDKYEYGWFDKIPEDMQYKVVKMYLFGTRNLMENYVGNSDFDSIFIMDVKEEYQGLVLLDFMNSDAESSMGEYYDLDLSGHPVLKKAIASGSEEIVFEKTDGFPRKGKYYIGYRPIVLEGNVLTVVGIVYNWSDIHDSVMRTINKAVIISAVSMVLIMVAIILFFNRMAVRPASRIKKAIIRYTDDKDADRIVGEMDKITARNELGYLANSISDLAKEIDHYTKENIRIAGEKEKAEKELYEAEVKIMVSQMRPHFIYNTLSSIAMLCDLDPKTAKEAAITFAKYLRANMDALKQTAPVSFAVEYEHLKNYLYIEKLRFDDLLNVEYDIQTTDFAVPALSIQPLAENAVKHGVGMKRNGGTVKISTRETADSYEVIISDDGVGFDVNAPKPDDGRSHVGMENTERRLREMCGADLDISSTPGEGTTVRVVLPKQKKEEPEK